MLTARVALIASLAVIAGGLAACGAEADPSAEGDGARHTHSLPSRGALGGYEHGRVWGWAQLIDDDTPVHVRIEVDGRPVTTLVADEPRRDLVEKGLHPTGYAGFSAVIDDLPPGADVEAIIEETGAVLTNSPCRVQGFGPVSSCTEGTARGAIDYHDGMLHGWAQIIGREEPVTVRVEVDGTPAAWATANRPRSDLVAQRLHRTGAAGFRIPLEIADGAEIAAYVDETGDPLMGVILLEPDRAHAPSR